VDRSKTIGRSDGLENGGTGDVVNLIWRHLAVIPDALPLAWGMLLPLYADGTHEAGYE
jgi:hypothetical protein